MNLCKICSLRLDIASGSQCPRCLTVHCPICGVPVHVFIAERHRHCRHLIAMASRYECDGHEGCWERSPFVRWNIQVPQAPAGMDWSNICRLVDAFGILLPLLNAYEEDGVDTRQLFDLLLEEVTTPVRRVQWKLASGAEPTIVPFGTDYFTDDPEKVRKEVGSLVALLKHGFERLDRER